MRVSQIVAATLLPGGSAAWAADFDIHMNVPGFLTAQQKKATVGAECSDFAVKRAWDAQTVYAGKVTGRPHG